MRGKNKMVEIIRVSRQMPKVAMRSFIAFSILFLCGGTMVHAQDRQDRQRPAMPTSELGRENLSRVAA
jgi:hypothetical protein